MSIEFFESLTHPGDVMRDVIVPVFAVLLGAVAGSAASYWASMRLASRSAREIMERDAAARRDQEQRAARQVFVKLSAIGNSLASFAKQVGEMIDTADRDGMGHLPVWQRLSIFPAIDREPAIDFTAEELAIYIAAKRPDYVDDLLLLARHHAANVASLAAFARMKTEFHYETAGLGRTTRDAGGFATTRMHVPPEVANYVRVKSEELDFFATEMCKRLTEAVQFAGDVASRFKPVTEAYLGEGEVPGLQWSGKVGADAPVTPPAAP